MDVITLLIGALIVGLVVVFVSPALYDRAKTLYLDSVAKPEPVLNIIKIQKIDFAESYIGGGNFFHTVSGKGRLIHLSPDFSEELVKKNLAAGFFDIPDSCDKCVSYMFHLKNTNNKTIRNLKLKFRTKGKLFEPNIKFVSSDKAIIVDSKCANNFCEINITRLSPMEILSFGILVAEPGDLIEVSCEAQDGRCAISHLGLFYGDTAINDKKIFLNYNNKEYFLPDINISPEKKDYQLINGVWTKYE